MKKPPLYFLFFLALFAALFSSVFFPSIRLAAFAPFLAISYYRLSYPKALWLSYLCGFILDLCSSSRLGLISLSFVLASALLYFQKRHFFEDKPSALALFSASVAAALALTELFLLYLFDKSLPLSGASFTTEVVLMPLSCGLYAFLWFTCPMRLYTYIQKTGLKGLFRKKKKDEPEEG